MKGLLTINQPSKSTYKHPLLFKSHSYFLVD
jgi:hypothetical protein